MNNNDFVTRAVDCTGPTLAQVITTYIDVFAVASSKLEMAKDNGIKVGCHLPIFNTELTYFTNNVPLSL